MINIRNTVVSYDAQAIKEPQFSDYPSVPYLDGEMVALNDEMGAVRLRADESTSGFLTISGTSYDAGVDAFVWEDQNLNGGIVLPNKYSRIKPPNCLKFTSGRGRFNAPTGNNPTHVSVKLSGLHNVRRLVVASQSSDLVLEVEKSSKTVGLETSYGDNVFLIYQIDNEIEIRREVIRSVELLRAFDVEHSSFAKK